MCNILYVLLLILLTTEIDCGAPPSVNHSSVTFTGTGHRSQAAYTCDVGFELGDQNSSTQCQGDGEWTAAPVCTGKFIPAASAVGL